MRLSLRSNAADVMADMDAWADQARTVAVPRALNKLRDQARTVGFRRINDIYRIGPRTMDLYTSARYATAAAPVADITVQGRGFPLYLFQPRQTAAGVSVSVKGRRFTVPHTFLSRMPSGHVGIFARGAYGGKSSGRALVATGETFGRFVFGRKRLPANELYTLSPPDALSNADVDADMVDRVQAQAATVLRAELRFALR